MTWLSDLLRTLAAPFRRAPDHVNETPGSSTRSGGHVNLGQPLITVSLLRTLGTADPDAWAAALAPACARFDITTKPRLAMFLANVIHESGGFRTLTESLNYRVEALIQSFGRHRISVDDARRLGRKPGQMALSPEQQNALADVLYGGEWGADHLGNTQPGDGSRFKGYGLIQATGRYMWERLRVAFRMGNLDDVRHWLLTKEGAALSAAWIWTVEKKCNPVADVGDVGEVRRKLNGGQLGLAEVTALYHRALAALG